MPNTPREKLGIDLYAMECFLRRNGSSAGCFEQLAPLLLHVLGHFYFNLKDSPFNNLWYRVKMMHFTPYLEMHNSLKVLVKENWGHLCMNFYTEWIFQHLYCSQTKNCKFFNTFQFEKFANSQSFTSIISSMTLSSWV